jgi:signal transduction histidine kinase
MAVDGLVILLIGYFLLTRLIVRPLIEIGRGTRRVWMGDYSKPVARGGIGEIGDLTRDFNAMVRQLRANREELEGQVQRLQTANEEIATAQATLIRTEKLATVGRLGTGMAHEIGNPLAAVLGYVELLREGEIAPRTASDLLARTQAELQRIDAIIRDLLDYARTDRDSTVGPVSIGPLIRSAVQLVESDARARNLEMIVGNVDAPTVAALEGKLRQVLVNLLLNAADAGAPIVTITAHTRDLTVDIVVEDTGPGIDDSVLPQLFEPFFTTKDPGEGTGLGLAISQSIITGFGGDITAGNSDTGGAQFTVSLPRSS